MAIITSAVSPFKIARAPETSGSIPITHRAPEQPPDSSLSSHPGGLPSSFSGKGQDMERNQSSLSWTDDRTTPAAELLPPSLLTPRTSGRTASVDVSAEGPQKLRRSMEEALLTRYIPGWRGTISGITRRLAIRLANPGEKLGTRRNYCEWTFRVRHTKWRRRRRRRWW